MPVNLLLCEGVEKSPDIRVLSKLLVGRCEVRALGGKYGMGERILARRETLKGDVVFGVLDGDFHEAWTPPENHPRRWIVQSPERHLGWRWERKEIENYLIDPIVAGHALGWTESERTLYSAVLIAARDRIASYQAARTALSVSRVRFKPLSNQWGRPIGRDKHELPIDFSVEVCRTKINELIQAHNESQAIDEAATTSSFERLMTECGSGGCRSEAFLPAFAG